LPLDGGEDNIKINFKEIGCVDVDCSSDFGQGLRVGSWDMTLNLCVPYVWGNILTG